MMTRFRCRAALSAHIAAAALGALLIASAFDAPAGAQSFDCRNARSADEKAICQDSRLGELDKQLADVYDRAGGKLSKQVVGYQPKAALERNLGLTAVSS